MSLVCVIPMAGEGKRFADKGYTFPKPLISIRGKPMIQWVVESLHLPLDTRYRFLVRRQDAEQYGLESMLKLIAPNSDMVIVKTPNEGAACTVLEGVEDLAPNDELLIANSDQWIDWDWTEVRHFMEKQTADGKPVNGLIPTFRSVHPKWSFVELAEDSMLVKRVAEKQPISPHATVGIYYFYRAELFRSCAYAMMHANKRVKGEFYVAPVFNEVIEHVKGAVYAYPVYTMWGLGTPEDLEEFKIKVCSDGFAQQR